MSPYPRLFSPIEIAGRRVRNRTVLPATLTNYGRANQVTDRWTNFLVERAKGGVGLLVSEIIAVDAEALAQQAIVTGFDATNEEGFRRTAEAVEEAGGLLVGQLWHPGRQQLWHPTKSPMGVSDLPDALSWTVPHVMAADEIERIAAAYVATAERLHRCGFAGVELHGAHGYLIGQFLSPWSNTRTDRYGGDLEGRARFAREIAGGIRAHCGAGFIVGLKMPGDEGVPGGIDVEEAARLTGHLAGSGDFDYFAYGQGNFSLSLETHVPDLHFRPGHFIDIPKRMRAAAKGVPVIALGRIGTPDLAEKVVAEGYGDLVGTTRALIADAAWPRKAEAGRSDTIRPSVFDNWCWGEVHMGKPLAEHHNPYLGTNGEAEAETRLTPTETPCRVLVVGAGPAGLEAAWVAAARGHAVILFGAGEEPGGNLRLDARLPGRSAMAGIIDYQRRMAEAAGVTFRLGARIAAVALLAEAPDIVVLATGARSRRPPNLVDNADPVIDARDYIAADETSSSRSERALLFDMDHGPTVYGIADLLAARHAGVVLATPRPEIARNVNYCSAIGVHRRLHQAGVEILPAHDLTDYRDGTVTLRNVFTEDARVIDDIARVIHATPRIARDELSQDLEGRVATHRIGDCQSPRDLMSAIQGGHLLGLVL